MRVGIQEVGPLEGEGSWDGAAGTQWDASAQKFGKVKADRFLARTVLGNNYSNKVI